MIDLHTHTTASDGRCTPAQLVSEAAAAGVTVLSVTDHDTVGAAATTASLCASAGIEFVPGIEITAVVDGADVHVLGYFIDTESRELAVFLAEQRRVRIDRLRRIVDRLAAFGIVLDADAILRPALDDPSMSVGRPWIARALVRGGHVATHDEAFEEWLTPGRPGYVPRLGAPPAEIFERIHAVGGLASLAHPVLIGHDEWLPQFANAGLDALEAFHSDHDPQSTRHYVDVARQLGLAVTGGSDYHGDPSHGGSPGSVSLPREAFERFKARRTLTS